MFKTIKNWTAKIRDELEEESVELDFDEEEGDLDGVQNTAQLSKGQVIAFMSGKGGVGKTGIAINVANCCAESKKKVLLIDCDLSTNGATVFFTEGKNIQIDNNENTLTLHRILSAYLVVNDDIARPEIPLRAEPVFIKQNFFFIPASVEDGDFRLGNIENDLLSKLEKDYFSKWRKEYDVIILDFAAGAGEINCLLSEISNRICIVTTPDSMSRWVVRKKLDFLFQKRGKLNRISCCVNKLNPHEKAVRETALFPEFPGFANSKMYAKKYENGEMIEVFDYFLWKHLLKIVEKIL